MVSFLIPGSETYVGAPSRRILIFQIGRLYGFKVAKILRGSSLHGFRMKIDELRGKSCKIFGRPEKCIEVVRTYAVEARSNIS